MALDIDPTPPEPAKTQAEMILDRIDELTAKIDKKKILRWLRILLRLAIIAFKFVPMTKDEKKLFEDITTGVKEGLDALED
jgi:hypothetical protein